MRIYEGSPRQDWEEVLRSVGSYLDQRGIRDILFVEAEGGFILQGVQIEGARGGAGEQLGTAHKETLQISDDEVAGFMDEAIGRRGQSEGDTPQHYETELRVLGRFIDEQRVRDLFFFEQNGAYVLRVSHATQAGMKHELFEFTREDVAAMIARAPTLRRSTTDVGDPAAPAG